MANVIGVFGRTQGREGVSVENETILCDGPAVRPEPVFGSARDAVLLGA